MSEPTPPPGTASPGYVRDAEPGSWVAELFTDLEIALFDGDRQLTDWQPYDKDTNTGVEAPEFVTEPYLKLRSPAGLNLSTAGPMYVAAGQILQLSHPSTWYISAM